MQDQDDSEEMGSNPSGSDPVTPPETLTEAPPATADPEVAQVPAEGAADAVEEPAEDADTFPREYVERLRTESAGYRTRANDLATELHALRVESLGLLADPEDLPYGPGLDTLEAVEAAAEDLVARKPHLKARRIGGNIGQHQQSAGPATVSLMGMMRKNA